MSNTDSFIEEVTEEVRRDRLFALMRRYGWIAIAAVVVLVGGAAYTEWQRATAQSEAQARGDALQQALAAADAAGRAEALAALEITGAAAAPAGLLEAASLAEAGETEAAAAKLADVAADPGHPRVWRDLAALKRLILLGRAISPEERLAAATALAAPGAPFRPLAVEQEALARIDLGETEAATGLLEGLLVDQQATNALRLRAAQLMVALSAQSPAGG